jgi:hypothetical protein
MTVDTQIKKTAAHVAHMAARPFMLWLLKIASYITFTTDLKQVLSSF